MDGRKPKSATLRDLHGRTSHAASKATRAAIRGIEPPPPSPGDLEPPADFNDETKAIWEHAITHAPANVLKTIDTAVLRAWAIACYLHTVAYARILREGEFVSPSSRPDYDGLMVQNPAIALLNRQSQVLMRCAEMLGFTPTSRPRLVGTKAATIDGEVQSLDEFLDAPLDLPSMHH
jgi:P27 family predicted phage terminase small subunit